MSTEIEKYEQTKEKVDKLNERIKDLKAQKQVFTKEYNKILAKYDVSSIEELREIFNSKKAEAEKEHQNALRFLEENTPIVQKLEDTLSVS